MRVLHRRNAKLIVLCLIFTVIFTIIVNLSSVQLNFSDGDKLFKQSNKTDKQIIDKTNQNSTLNLLYVRSQRSANGVTAFADGIGAQRQKVSVTSLEDVFISVKTTEKNHKPRLYLLLDTWISTARKQTYIFTDTDDKELKDRVEANHVINTNCSKDHYRKSLVCKMAQEFDWFINSKKRWFCHVDDDTYLNVHRLVSLLKEYNHTDDWYLGRPSLNHPIEVLDRVHAGQHMAFWFATGGAGFCISRALALKMVPYAGGGRLKRAGDQIRLPDDCTIGYVINSILRKDLTVINLFHSHLEALWKLGLADIKEQISFSYGVRKDRQNVVNIHGFNKEKDPTRFLSIHCHLYPLSQICLPLES